MKKNFASRRPVPLLLFLLAPFALWAADGLGPGDFAGAMAYSGKGGSLLSIEIPLEAYRGLRRPDLGDIRIFDASNQPVPFAIRERPGETFVPAPEEVPFFIWDGGTENDLPVNTDIEITASGGVVKIKNQNAPPRKPGTFLADLSSLEYAPSTLAIETGNGGENFNASVSIHWSGDLSNWKAFGKKQTLASFGSPDAAGTVQDTLELPPAGGIEDIRYLLVVFGNGAPAPSRMIAGFAAREKPARWLEVEIPGTKSPDGKRIRYDTGAYYPAESVDFVLAEADSIQALVKNRFDEKDEWAVQARGTVFRYQAQAGVEKNPPFAIASRAPYWELEAAGDLPFSSVPDLKLRWKPREIVFPGRGEGPWTLAYGNAGAGPLETELLLPAEGGETLEEARFTGEKRYDEKAGLAPLPGEGAGRMILLWIFLGAAALVLSALAIYIAKSIRT